MRTIYKTAIAATVAAVIVPTTIYYYLKRPSDIDPMTATLREFGFVRVPMATKLMSVGSLYYVDSRLKDFKTVCRVDKAELGEDAIVSPGMDIEQNLERSGQLDARVTVDLTPLVKGAAENDDRFVHKVRFSLTDVVVEELPLDRSLAIYQKKMDEPGCDRATSRYVNDAPRGYVCQAQKILKATAKYTLDGDVHDDLKATATLSAINGRIKQAIEAQGNTSVVERGGSLYSGSALTWGVSMVPTCLAPATARFQRILPQNRFDRFADYVKFKLVEPLWPAAQDRTQLAQVDEAERRAE